MKMFINIFKFIYLSKKSLCRILFQLFNRTLTCLSFYEIFAIIFTEKSLEYYFVPYKR